jgi:hypothetical protein
MILSLAEKPELEITFGAMTEAIEVCEKFMEGIRRATINTKGKAQYADQKAMILNELIDRENHQISREQLMKKFWMHVNSDELDIIMRSLDEAKLVKPHNHGNVLVYEMSDKTANDLKSYLKAKKTGE